MTTLHGFAEVHLTFEVPEDATVSMQVGAACSVCDGRTIASIAFDDGVYRCAEMLAGDFGREMKEHEIPPVFRCFADDDPTTIEVWRAGELATTHDAVLVKGGRETIVPDMGTPTDAFGSPVESTP